MVDFCDNVELNWNLKLNWIHLCLVISTEIRPIIVHCVVLMGEDWNKVQGV